ncbi:hypothetical protein G7K_5947-t1 [Saitoella complicata NRRL Y-17804]|uniref:Uncharacterized protein n=1 Tax=Saitoella complicata (strain BCRC 22490 / CBS 7301 / JCM 7358 / NBRC 10748 / NRRL Y-17804) TaxID=698492 RepID=A0A0E9NQ87_SAICN|nr:hypothetical protein G7K_5947-t1 [Saitoella complicata NRRL Y-17804]
MGRVGCEWWWGGHQCADMLIKIDECCFWLHGCAHAAAWTSSLAVRIAIVIVARGLLNPHVLSGNTVYYMSGLRVPTHKLNANLLVQSVVCYHSPRLTSPARIQIFHDRPLYNPRPPSPLKDSPTYISRGKCLKNIYTQPKQRYGAPFVNSRIQTEPNQLGPTSVYAFPLWRGESPWFLPVFGLTLKGFNRWGIEADILSWYLSRSLSCRSCACDYSSSRLSEFDGVYKNSLPQPISREKPSLQL